MSGQIWGTVGLGGYMHSVNLSRKLRTALQPMVRFRQFCDAREAFGLGKGETFNWNVYSDLATQGASISETQVMPESNFTITQSNLTITEYGNSVPFTKKLDDLSEHPVTEIIHKVLKNDARRALDTAAHAQFDACVQFFVGTDAGTVANEQTTVSSNNGAAMNMEHIRQISDYMVEDDVPTFRTLKTELESVHQYVSEGWHVIMNGEKGRFEGIRFVEQTHIAAEATATWDAGGTVSDAAYFFGADTVIEAFAIPEEIRGKIPTDFGRSRGIAWYAELGYGIAQTALAEARIYKWASAS